MSDPTPQEPCTHIGESVNQYGTFISIFKCKTCGDEFTVCPAVPTDALDQWTECMSESCASYDVTRDVEIFWDALDDNELIHREER